MRASASSKEVFEHSLLEWLVVTLTFLLTNVVCALTQPALSFMGGHVWEVNIYYEIAEHFRHSLPIVGVAPAVYRIGISWLAAALPIADLSRSFFYINLLSNALTIVFLVLLLRYFIASWKLRAVLIGFYIIHWLAPTRFLYFVSADSDSAAIFFLTVGLYLIERWRRKETLLELVLLCLLVAVGVFVREIILILPIMFIVTVQPVEDGRINARRLMIALIPLVCGAIVFAGIRMSIATTASFSFASSALNWAYAKPLPGYILGGFIAIGPVLVLLALDWKTTRALLRENPALIAFALIIVFLSFCGGSDTERFFLWGTPVILILIGSWFERNRRITQNAGLLILIITMQLVSERAFWSTPDLGYAVQNSLIFLTSMSSTAYYLFLFSYHAPKAVSALMLIEYAAVATVILAWAYFRLVRIAPSDRFPEPVEVQPTR